LLIFVLRSKYGTGTVEPLLLLPRQMHRPRSARAPQLDLPVKVRIADTDNRCVARCRDKGVANPRPTRRVLPWNYIYIYIYIYINIFVHERVLYPFWYK
jgi:hypothetical protein